MFQGLVSDEPALTLSGDGISETKVELVWDDSTTARVHHAGARDRPLAWFKATRNERGDVVRFDIYADAAEIADRVWMGRASTTQAAVEFCAERESPLQEMEEVAMRNRLVRASDRGDYRRLIEEGHQERLSGYEGLSWRPCTWITVINLDVEAL